MIMKTAMRALPIILLLTDVSAEQRDVFYPSSGAIGETILEKSGLNTSNARMVTRSTERDAKEHCDGWMFKSCKDVLADVTSSPNSVYTANCRNGTVTMIEGGDRNELNQQGEKSKTFSYKGVAPQEGGGLYQKWVNVATGEVVGTCGACGYWSIINQHETLCPTAAASAKATQIRLEAKLHWKHQAFGELEFIMIGGQNLFVARFRGFQPDGGVQFSLGTQAVIPVLYTLSDETLRYPEAFAVVRANGTFYAVSEIGRAVADLNSMLSPAIVRRISEIFAERALRAEHKIDEGMYEGIVVVLPTSRLPLRTVDAVESLFRGLLVELILDKIQRLTGKGWKSQEARVHASAISGSQKMVFFAEFPLYISKDSNGSYDIVKAMHFMTDPDAAQAAMANAEIVALQHEGNTGHVMAVEELESGFRIIIRTSYDSVVYDSVLFSDLKVGQMIQSGEIIGLIKNPKKAGR